MLCTYEIILQKNKFDITSVFEFVAAISSNNILLNINAAALAQIVRTTVNCLELYLSRDQLFTQYELICKASILLQVLVCSFSDFLAQNQEQIIDLALSACLKGYSRLLKEEDNIYPASLIHLLMTLIIEFPQKIIPALKS